MIKVITLCITISVLNLLGCSQQEVHTGKSELAMNHSENIITASALSKDGQLNLVADGKTVCLWNKNQLEKPLQCLIGNKAQFIELVDISENNQFYLVSNQVSVSLYTVQGNKQLGEWQVDNNIINDMDISADGKKILLGFRSGKATIINVVSNKTHTFDKHRLDINSVSLSDNGSMALTGSSDKKARLWQTGSGEDVYEFSHGSRVNHVNMSGDAKVAFTLDAVKDRTFWDLSTGNMLAELETNLRFFEFNDSLFSADNSLLLTGSPKQIIKLWRVIDGVLIAEWQSEMTRGRSSILSVAYLEQDKVVTTNSDGLFEQWALPPGLQKLEIQ